MNNSEALSATIVLPDALSVENISENRRPLLDDWILIQGGMPEVVPVMPELGLYNAVHKYQNTEDPSGTGVIIPTSVSIVENWSPKKITVILPDGREVDVPTALLWKYHGKPCERRSRTKYDRIPINQAK